MLIRDSKQHTRDAPVIELGAMPDEIAVERRAWWNWLLVSVMLFLTTTGLAVALLALPRDRSHSPWPWPHSNFALLIALVVAQFVFIGFLTLQQKRVIRVRRALALLRRETLHRMERHYRRLDDILEVTRTIGVATEPQTAFDIVTRTCANTFHCDQVSLMLYHPTDNVLEVRSAVGHEEMNRVMGARQRLGHGVAGWVAEHREPLILGPQVDPDRFRDLKNRVATLSAAMVVPIVLEKELLGVLSASSRLEGLRYDKNDLRALQVFAGIAGAALHHAQQHERVRETVRRPDAEPREQDIRMGLLDQEEGDLGQAA
jgi:putative methionine-R-sulfoxide reductase with GAF domain